MIQFFKEATRRLASILCNIMENSIGWSSQGKGAVGFYFLLYSRTTVCVVACSKERKEDASGTWFKNVSGSMVRIYINVKFEGRHYSEGRAGT